MSNFDEQQLNQLYSWIDQATLSRPKRYLSRLFRNIARDFSDAVLMAQLIWNYQPKLVDIHNYPTSSSVKAKISNWNILNTKVLSKIDIYLTPQHINDIANSKPLAIQRVLLSLKERLQLFERNAPESIKRHQQEYDDEGDDKPADQMSRMEQLRLIYRLLLEKVQSVERNIRRKDQHILELKGIIQSHRK